MLNLLFTNLLFNIGLHLAIRDLPAFVPLMTFVKKHKALQTLCAPLFLCLECMSSFWGLLFWLSNYTNGLDYTVLFAPLYVLSLYGLVRVYSVWIEQF